MAVQTGSYDFKAAKEAHDAASKTASNYITDMTNGIMVHAEGDGPDDTATPSGWHISDVLEYIRQGVSRFWIGLKNSGDATPTVRIGKEYISGATDNESHMELDYHSLQMVAKEGDTYLHISDLRLADGVYTATETLPIRNKYPSSDKATVTTGIHPIEEIVSVTYNSGADDDTANWSIRLSSSGSQLASDNLIRSGSFDDVEMSHIEDGSVTVVYKTKASMAKAFTFGGRQSGSAIGGMSFASGDYNVASGFSSAAFGSLTKAKSSCSFAEGDYTEAIGAAAHSEGVSTKAKGIADHAEGWSAVAEGGGFGDDQWGEMATQDEKYAPAHAEGYQTQATAAGSHAEGLYSTATSPGAHAGGCKSEAKGQGSFAHGYRVIANGQGQAVFGNRNVEDTDGIYALIVGNGEGLDDETSNALGLTWAGDLDLGKAGGASRTVSSPSELLIAPTRGAATRYRMCFTNAGNIRLEQSTDSGTTWSTVTYFQKENRVQPVANGGTGNTAVVNNSTQANIISAASGISITAANVQVWGKVAMLSVAYTVNKEISVPASGNITDVNIGTVKDAYKPYTYARLTSENYGNRFILKTDGTLTMTSTDARGAAYTSSPGYSDVARGTYLLHN